jgi:hypothetical protein
MKTKLLGTTLIALLVTGCAATVSKTTEPVAAANQFYKDEIVEDVGFYSLMMDLKIEEMNSIKYAYGTYQTKNDSYRLISKLTSYCASLGGKLDRTFDDGIKAGKSAPEAGHKASLNVFTCGKNDKVLFSGDTLEYYKYEIDFGKGYSTAAQKQFIRYVDLFLAQPKGNIDNATMLKDAELAYKKTESK